ncbi:DUF2637 domain-containing protein [Streptomyces jumonjinensis]|nr:DUF2637 domain-containing protein [Streptomyces jumonjinensis]
MTGWDSTAIVLLGAAGFAFSYDALREMAIAIHARPALSYLFPVFIDGFIAYGVRALVLLRNRAFGARLYAWFLFLAATGASIWANVLHAVTLNQNPPDGPSALYLGDTAVGVLSTLAPLALGGSVHLFIVVTRTGEPSVPDRSGTSSGPVRESLEGNGGEPSAPERTAPAGMPPGSAGRGSTIGPYQARGRHGGGTDRSWAGLMAQDAPATGHPADGERDPSAVREHREPTVRGTDEGSPEHGPDGFDPADRTATPGAGPDVHSPDSAQDQSPAGAGSVPVPDGRPPADRELVDESLVELLPLAREAARRAGRISRSAVAEAVRAHQPISNDRLGELLVLLRAEEKVGQPTTAAADDSSHLW